MKKKMLKLFKEGKIAVDFRGCYGKQVGLLRKLLRAAYPKSPGQDPAYSFDQYYYCERNHWYGTGRERKPSKQIEEFFFKKYTYGNTV